MPAWLKQAYWRGHDGRALKFRTADGGVAFDVQPQPGMPQGDPERPMVYACVMEDVLEAIEADLAAAHRPA